MLNESPEIRDLRRHDNFRMDDDFIDDGFVAAIGERPSLIYMMLCRHAGPTQECWPGIDRMAEKMKWNARTVMRAIQRLEAHRLIEVVRRKGPDGRQAVNIYKLLHKNRWSILAIELPGDASDTRQAEDKRARPGDSRVQNRVTPPGDSRVTIRVRTKDTNNKKRSLHVPVGDNRTGTGIESVSDVIARRGYG